MNQVGGFALGLFRAAVVACRGGHIRMPENLLHRHDVGARVEQVPGQGAPQIMGRKMLDARLQ